MLKPILATVALLTSVSAPAVAQQYQGGYSAAIQAQTQNQLMEAQTWAINAYTSCLRATNDASKCGPPPQMNFPPRRQYQAQQRVPVTDYGCVDGNIRGGQTWANAMQACTRYQAQQRIPVTDYGCVDGNVRGGQTYANAMSACTR
ncbi:MAG: hypothetical protein ACREYD_06445 [Casimicrobiaceae bacterium]